MSRDADAVPPFLRAAMLGVALLSATSQARGQGRDLVRLTDGRELQGHVTAQRYDRLEVSLRSGAKTSMRWDKIESIDFDAPRPFVEGLSYESMGLHEEARASFSEARSLDELRRPLKQEVLYHLARLRGLLGDGQGALATYRELVTEFPRGRYLGEATRSLVTSYLAEGQADEAAEVLDATERTVSGDPQAQRLAAEVTLFRGLVAQARGQQGEARLLLEKACADPVLQASDHALAALAVGQVLEAAGEQGAALARFRDVVEMEAAPAAVLSAAWNSLADAELEDGRRERDAERITRALFGYLRGVTLYRPRGAERHDEYRRALAGAAQCFEYLSQLASDRDQKLLNHRRAADLRDRLRDDER